MSDTTYRYGIIIAGSNYAPGDVTVPSHVWMAETLGDVRRILRNARANCPWRYDLDGDGKRILETPPYGHEGHGALIYRVKRDDPQFAEVLDLPGDRARHAFAWLDPEPIAQATFGPRGGLSIHNA